MHDARVDRCLHCGCPCAVDAWGNPGSAFALRSSCQHGMCGCHQLADASHGGMVSGRDAHGGIYFDWHARVRSDGATVACRGLGAGPVVADHSAVGHVRGRGIYRDLTRDTDCLNHGGHGRHGGTGLEIQRRNQRLFF